MKEEHPEIPITRDNILAISNAVRANPASPVIVPMSYGQVRVPGTLPECIDGVLNDPTVVYLNGWNVPVGPSYFHADEHGHIYDAMSMGITAQSLKTAVSELTTAVWTLQLNLGDPGMPEKLREFHHLTPAIGLIAIVTPQAVHDYLNRLAEFNPVVHFPV